MRTPILCSLTLLCLSTASACDVLDVGEPLDASEGGSCTAEATAVADIDAPTRLGFSARDVLDRVQGEHRSEMVWSPDFVDGEIKVEISTQAGPAELTAALRYEGGAVREIRSDADQSELTLGGGFGGCPDYLEIDVELDVFTDDGALAETLPATLRSWDPRFARIELELPLDTLAGSLTIDVVSPANAELANPTLTLGISALGLSGGLNGGVEIQDGNAVLFGRVPVAAWPSAEKACDPDEAAAKIDGAFGQFSANDVLARINAVENASLRWQNGSSSAFDISAEHGGDPVCFTAIPEDDGLPVGDLRTAARFSAFASDQSMAGVFDVEVFAEPADDGSLGDVRVDIYAPYASTLELDAFAETYGITGVDLSAYDQAGLTFSGVFSADGSASGAMTVLGVIEHDCSQNAPGEGCEGNEIVELAMAEWRTGDY